MNKQKAAEKTKMGMLIFKFETSRPRCFQYKIGFKYDVWKLPLAPSPGSTTYKGERLPIAAGLPKEIRFTVRVGVGRKNVCRY